MDILMMTASALIAIGVMVAYALVSQRPTEERLPIRIRVEDRKRKL
ncbi:hypothetical protein [Celeribacter sp. ULVN23_4]